MVAARPGLRGSLTGLIDDEPLTAADAAAIEAGIASLERGEGVPMEEVLAEF